MGHSENPDRPVLVDPVNHVVRESPDRSSPSFAKDLGGGERVSSDALHQLLDRREECLSKTLLGFFIEA
jgi:hypothetical protein